jgi:predicted lipoprotein with Yx(FWY)xxD motif
LLCGTVGASLLVATGAIHLDLYLTGYRSIPTIGWLFLLQVISAFALAVAILATVAIEALASRPGSSAPSGLKPVSVGQLAAASGALFALATLGGYLLSLRVGLFGFREVRTTAGIVAGVIEVAAFAALAVVAFPPLAAALARRALAATAVVSVVALALLGADAAVGQGGSGQPGSSTAGQVLKTGRTGTVTLLTNAKGLTLYWFAPDTTSASHCTGTCAVYWPPVFGKPTAGTGVTGTLGTITRPDGTTQATYNGHPLYTYVGDTGPGQASGNNLDLNGGLWHDIAIGG